MEEKIKEKYQEFGYPSPYKLFKIMKKDEPDVKFNKIIEVVENEKPYQLHKKTKSTVQAHMVAFRENQIWLADLLDMSNYSRDNKGFKWILLVIDVFTRQCFAEPMKNKEKESSLSAFKKIIEDNGKPEKLITDNGSEFTNREFQKLLAESKIFHETNEPHYHQTLGLIDRLCRTIKEKIFKFFTDKNETNWLDHLQSIISAYNQTPHEALKDLTPQEASEERYKVFIQDLNKKKNVISNHYFKEGQIVRKKLVKPTFAKGYKQIWGGNVHELKEVKGVNGVLNDGQIVKLNDLQVIPKKPTDEPKPEPTKVEKVEKQAKIEKVLKSVGMDQGNVVEGKRQRKRKEVFDL
jgi:hypothetical protein